MPSHVFSLPSLPPGDGPAVLDGLTLVTADATLHAAAHGVHFMHMVESNLRRRKLPRTQAARAFQGMSCPVCVQRYEEVARAHTPVETVTLRPHGTLVLRDLLDLAPFRLWRGGLRLWQHTAGPEPGTLTVCSPDLISLRDWDMSAAETPAIVVLDKLVEDGWRVGKPPAAHTLSTQNGSVKLLALPRRARAAFSYRSAGIVVGQGAAVLQRRPRRLSRDYPSAGVVAHGSIRNRASAQDSDGSADDTAPAAASSDVPMALLGYARAKACTALARTRAKRARVSEETIAETMHRTALWHALPRALPEEQAPHETAAVPLHDFSPAAVPVQEGTEESRALALPAPVPSAPALGTLVDMVEGQPVRVEERGMEGAPGYYRRIFVTCPLHTSPGSLPCRLRRNTGPRQTAKLGIHEPLAYLCAWLAAAPGCASREEHVAHKPSEEDTRAYALRTDLAR